MRHAQALAVAYISGAPLETLAFWSDERVPVTPQEYLNDFNRGVSTFRPRACDWTKPTDPLEDFTSESALALLPSDVETKMTISRADLPTCPECAVFVDIALEERAAPAPVDYKALSEEDCFASIRDLKRISGIRPPTEEERAAVPPLNERQRATLDALLAEANVSQAQDIAEARGVPLVERMGTVGQIAQYVNVAHAREIRRLAGVDDEVYAQEDFDTALETRLGDVPEPEITEFDPAAARQAAADRQAEFLDRLSREISTPRQPSPPPEEPKA